MNLCYLAKFGKNKFNLWHMLLGAIAGGAHTVSAVAAPSHRVFAGTPASSSHSVSAERAGPSVWSRLATAEPSSVSDSPPCSRALASHSLAPRTVHVGSRQDGQGPSRGPEQLTSPISFSARGRSPGGEGEGAASPASAKETDLVSSSPSAIRLIILWRLAGADLTRWSQCVRQRPKGPVPLKLIN